MRRVRGLLQTDAFLKNALEAHGRTMTAQFKDNLMAERDKVLLDLLRHPSSDPRVTAEQIRVLLTSLANLAKDPIQAEVVRNFCQTAVDHLVRQALQGLGKPDQPPRAHFREAHMHSNPTGLAAHEIAVLEASTDRAAIYDRRYCFVFVNKANADFHGMAASEFVGRPCQSIVGKDCFEQMTKSRLDACFDGRIVSMTAHQQPDGKAPRSFTVRFEPVRDSTGDVIAALVVARESARSTNERRTGSMLTQ